MEIVCCRSIDEAARKAFRLRYEVYGAEMGLQDGAIDHQNELFTDQFDDAAKIYVAIRQGNAVATCRSVYDRDCDFSSKLPHSILSALDFPNFLKGWAGSLAVSSRFAISPSHRGSLAAHLVTAKMFEDIIEDDVHFVFSWCAPQLYDFYSQLGFHIFSRTIKDDNGLWAPIVLATRDWDHLRSVRSPLFKYLERKNLCNGQHSSVKWFYDNYGGSVQPFLSRYDEGALETMLSGSEGSHSEHNLKGVGIFDFLTAEDARKIIGAGRVLQFSAGEAIISTAQVQDEMFIVLDGEVLETRLDGALPSSKIAAGQVIGEIALLTGTMRATDCIALSDTKLITVSRHGLARLMKGNPDIASRFLYNLCRLQSYRMLSANHDMTKLYLDLHHGQA